jgi:hypothetical protein
MNTPIPTPIYRFLHVDNLGICLHRRGLHAPNHSPANGETYRTIHNLDIQRTRSVTPVRCGPGGVIHDYVSFYFGPRSPMLYQLHTGWVEGYTERQDPLIYVVSTAQAVQESGIGFTFSDGHGIAAFTKWFDDLADLDKVDWKAAYARMWRDTVNDMDLQRRKQAEFLVYRSCDWRLIHGIGVLNAKMRARVEDVFEEFAPELRRPVRVRANWYY